MKKIWSVAAAVTLIGPLAVGCQSVSKSSPPAGNADQAAANKYTGEPVELVIKDENTAIASDESIQKVIVQLVKAKHPEITLKFSKEKIENLLTSGSPPDLVATSPSLLTKYLLLDFPVNLSPTIKQSNLDLNRIEPAVVEAIKGYGKNGAIYGLPFNMNHGATIYNKDIFDRFGVPYPKDNLTWEDFLELSRRLTREEGGRQYIGGGPAFTIVNQFRQYGASSVDASGEKALLTSEGFRNVAAFVQKFYQIPGFIQPVEKQKSKYSYGNDEFFKEQNLAMFTGYLVSHLNQIGANPPAFKWDLTSYPVYKDRPNMGNPVDFHMLAVSQTSKHKDAAYRVMQTLLTEEAQLAISKAGRISVLKDTKIKQALAQDAGVFQGKNLESVFKVPNSQLVSSDYSKYKDDIAPFIKNAVEDIALNGTDVNTSLRMAEEKANQAIQSKNAK